MAKMYGICRDWDIFATGDYYAKFEAYEYENHARIISQVTFHSLSEGLKIHARNPM